MISLWSAINRSSVHGSLSLPSYSHWAMMRNRASSTLSNGLVLVSLTR